jgi:putative addiction module component (TIGR02574 family)
MKSLEDIASEALLLPKDQRFTLAHRILSSVEPDMKPEAEAAWDMEIRERIRRYDAGLGSGVPGQEVFAELDKKLKE